MTVSDLPVEGPRPWPGTSDHQFDSAGRTEAHRHCRAAAGSWTYTRLRTRSPKAASAATRAVRELASVVLILTKAVEGVVDAVAPLTPRRASSGGNGGYSQPLVDAWEDE